MCCVPLHLIQHCTSCTSSDSAHPKTHCTLCLHQKPTQPEPAPAGQTRLTHTVHFTESTTHSPACLLQMCCDIPFTSRQVVHHSASFLLQSDCHAAPEAAHHYNQFPASWQCMPAGLPTSQLLHNYIMQLPASTRFNAPHQLNPKCHCHQVKDTRKAALHKCARHAD